MDDDYKLINVLLNNKRELKEFCNDWGEDLFDEKLMRFVKHLISYFNCFNSCPSMSTLIDFATNGSNSNLEEYIIEVWNESDEHAVDGKEYSYILEKLKNRKRNELYEQIANVIADKDKINDPTKKITKLFNDIKSLDSQKLYSAASIKEDADNYVERFKARQKTPELAKGVFTGFSIFDYYTNGLRPSELGVIAADTGGGKSIFLINLAVNAYMGTNILPNTSAELNDVIKNNSWEEGSDVLFISLEMPKDEIEDRIIACMTSINSLSLMKGNLQSKEEATKLSLALKFWKHYPGNLKIVDMPRGCSMSDVQAIFDDTCLEFRPKLVIIDYLGLMTDKGEDSDADWQKLMKVAEECHEFCRYNEVATFTAIQAKSIKPSAESKVGLYFASGRSSMIVHNANIVLQIETRENEDSRSDSVIHCIKFRRGPKFVMNNLRKEFPYNRFADLGMQSAEEQKEQGKFGEDLSSLLDNLVSNTEDSKKEEEE